MGQVVDKLAAPLQEGVTYILKNGRKRKRSMDSTPDKNCDSEVEDQTPKKKKLLSTTQYIFQTLYKGEKNYDVTVMALGKMWRLHKLYLSQSPYFHSMFNGSWKEASQEFVSIQILDSKITIEALDAVFGSLYSDEIQIEPKDVIGILATATLFHLESIIEKCSEVMIETINVNTVIDYYEVGCAYGCLNVKKTAFDWLEKNLLCTFPKHLNQLRCISVDLMTKLISSTELYVMQTEFSIYTLLRTWAYLRLHPNFLNDDGQIKSSLTEVSSEKSPTEIIHAYYNNRPKTCSFLASVEGQQFKKPFQVLRTQYLTNHHTDLKIVLSDNILPKEWINAHVLDHWNSILKVDHVHSEEGISCESDVFLNNCMRCGRILEDPGYQKWRWTGFNFGLDLILIVDSRVLSIRRHHRIEHERLLSLQTKRPLMIRASITSIDGNHKPIATQISEISLLSLEKNEEKTLLVMDQKLVYPLLISLNLLVVDPPTNPNLKDTELYITEDVNIPISEIGANTERAVTPSSSNDSAVFVVSPAKSQRQTGENTTATCPRAALGEYMYGNLSSASSSGEISIGTINCMN